jgi:hypothetical protein
MGRSPGPRLKEVTSVAELSQRRRWRRRRRWRIPGLQQWLSCDIWRQPEIDLWLLLLEPSWWWRWWRWWL